MLYSQRHKDDGQAVKEATVMPEGRYVHQNLQTKPYGDAMARESVNMDIDQPPRFLTFEEVQAMNKQQAYEKSELDNTRRRAALEVKMYEKAHKNYENNDIRESRNFGMGLREKNDSHQNQEMKKDLGKPRLALVPPSLIEAVGQILTFGAAKYEPNGWKRVDPDRYKDAMVRHLCAYLEDEFSVDEESGLPHLWHMTCNAAFLIDFQTHTGT